MARIPTRIPGGLLVVTVVLPFSLALGTVTAHAAAPLGQGAPRTARALAPETPEVRDPRLAERRHRWGEGTGPFGLDVFGAAGAGDLASVGDLAPGFADLPGGDALPDGQPRPHHPAEGAPGPPRPHASPHKPHRPAAPTPPAPPAPPTPPAPGSAAPRLPAPPASPTAAPHRAPDDRPAKAAAPPHEAGPSHHHPARHRPVAPPHRPKRVPAAVPHAVPAEETPTPGPRTVRDTDDQQAPEAQAEPPADGTSYPFAGTGSHAERVLPMGAGMALTGLGLAFLALRLRRG
ncbi:MULTISPECIES: hypothetical protein [Streptomyces]|uniref:Gram-positive cocci surface proteins LPxTG domain-containing protein n=1 Tax=Streptomyces ramulosus TaxID=47762 RepID=A0ABW1FMN0_9ACTN